MKMLECNAPGCSTVENTQINGKTLTLFSFPTYDDSLVKQWEDNSKVIHAPEQNPADLKLCELHFETDSFASEAKNALAPGAVPTIFEFNTTKRTIKEEDKPDESEEPPMKIQKIEQKEETASVETSVRSPLIQSETEAVADEEKKPMENSPQDLIDQTPNTPIRNSGQSSVFTKQIDLGKNVYRLIIRIDKVIEEKEVEKKTKEIKYTVKQPQGPKSSKSTHILPKNSSVIKPCEKIGCKLVKTTLNSKPAFKCERCQKHYIVRESKTKASNNCWPCYICKQILPSADSLSFHVSKHLTCDMCQARCSTQISYDKHLRLHVSTDPLLPYKCHKCSNIFEVKADVRQHYTEKHVKNSDAENKQRPIERIFRCPHCPAVYVKEQSFKFHIQCHMITSDSNGSSGSEKFDTAENPASRQTRFLSTLKFTCQVCAMEFTNPEIVEAHMKTHVEVTRKKPKCNLCGKVFNTASSLDTHMEEHLSRAHRCPTCNKAFINKTSLRIHYETHSKESSNASDRDSIVKKKHACTLCPNTFANRTRLYNHIMTHLEQMHGGEGGETVFDGLNQLLEHDQEILS